MGIVQTKEKLYDTNIADAQDTHLFIARKANAEDVGIDWKYKWEIHWSKYQIKETDMRVKTATFTSPNYFDLTTGVHCVLIMSKMHENFGGEIIKVSYDKNTKLYEYQCQDFSRDYQSKFEIVAENLSMHRALQYLLTRDAIDIKGKISSSLKKQYKRELSGLRPAYQYEQKYWGSTFNFNPMTQKNKLIIRNKSFIEAIRDLVYSSGAYIDVYFDIYGICHIAPYTKDDFYNSGLRLTSPEIAEAKYSADITNIVTDVRVHSTDKTKIGVGWKSKNVVNINLSAFFGTNRISIENPNQSESTTATASSTSPKKAISSKKTSNIYGTKKKIIYLNTDLINGYSTDRRRMEDMAKILRKNGWEVHIMGVGASSHYKDRGKVKKGIWFCLYGGACAGTLKEHCTSSWFLNPLKKNKSRVVVGFFPPSGNIRKGGKYYKHLGPAHDWGGSRAYANIDYPAKFLSKHGVPFMYADNAKQMVSKFLAGGDNYSTSGSSYKNHGSWTKHNVKWIK